ncbi:HS12B-like protein, partial [Mya arenaria]
SKPMLVAAIDFGTMYSSWAYSLLHEFKNDPTQISAKQWQGQESTKGPTTVLIKPDGKTLEAFGFEAETRYTELIDEDEHESYYFFKRFKMKLWNQASTCQSRRENLIYGIYPPLNRKIERDMLIEDENSRWYQETNLTVALEPEAASLFCRLLPVERSGNKTSLGKLKAKQKYLVLDAGDRETYNRYVFLCAGFDAMADLKRKHLDDYIELFRRFENKKRSISPDIDSKTVIPLPQSLCSLIEKRQGRALCDLIKNTSYANLVSMKNEKVNIDASVARHLPIFTTCDKNPMYTTDPGCIQ